MPWIGDTPTRTDGTRTGPTVWDQAAVAVETILSADHDTHDQDLASMIGLCLHRGGANAVTADIPWGSFKITNLGNGTAATDAVNKGQMDAANAAQDTVINGKLANVVEDTTPQLGGNLDTNGNSVVTVSNADLNLTPDGTGRVIVPRLTLSGYQFPDTAGADGQILRLSGGNLVYDNETIQPQPVTAFSASADLALPGNGAFVSANFSTFTPTITGPVDRLTAELVCVTNNTPYVAGEVVTLTNINSAFGDRGLQVYRDDTTAKARIGAQGIYLFSSGGTVVQISLGSWRLRFIAYKR